MKIDANTILVFSLIKIIGGGLTVCMGRSTNKVFKPILKEYRDAERGITQGITMNIRRSKKMQHLKKKICKITLLMVLVGFIAIVYTKNFMHGMVDQYLDQKYDFIQHQNATDNSTNSVENVKKQLYNQTTNHEDANSERRGDDAHFDISDKNLKDWRDEPSPYRFGSPSDFDDNDFDGNFYDQEGMTQLFLNHHGGKHGKHHFNGNGYDETKSHKHGKRMAKPEVDPYKKWLDSLHKMSKEDAKIVAKQFWNQIILFSAIWGTIGFAV